MIKVVYPNCAGLDVHKKFVSVCRLTVNKQGHTAKELRQYATMTAELVALSDWLAEGGSRTWRWRARRFLESGLQPPGRSFRGLPG